MARYLVTGATGFIGGEVARQLRTAGHQVATIARDPARAEGLIRLGVEAHRGDITDPATLVAPMAGVDGVFHIAAWYEIGARDRSMAWRINVDGTRNVLEAMRSAGVPKGVYTSTLAVFGDTHGKLVDETYFRGGPWLTEYDRTKWAAHYEVALPMMKDGLPLVIVQPGLVYGPGDHSELGAALVRYLGRRLPAVPAGCEYCWGHVEDIARAHLLAMERGRPGETYIVAGPRHSLIEAFGIAQRITGIPAPRLHPAPVVMRALARLMGLVERVVPLPASYTYEGLMVGAGVTYLGDNAKARRELGFAPRPLEEGLGPTLEHAQSAVRARASS
jgi:nucleoside-diphosphate-sugar epimerase